MKPKSGIWRHFEYRILYDDVVEYKIPTLFEADGYDVLVMAMKMRLEATVPYSRFQKSHSLHDMLLIGIWPSLLVA